MHNSFDDVFPVFTVNPRGIYFHLTNLKIGDLIDLIVNATICTFSQFPMKFHNFPGICIT